MESESVGSQAILYCPEDNCCASSGHNVGLRRPLIEIPIDPNHVQLFCPFCETCVVQCDACSCLISFDESSASEDIFHACRKCGLPNIRDESLRLSLGLPRTLTLPYPVARVIQRAINAQLYSIYKTAELRNLSEMFEGGKLEQIIVGDLNDSDGSQTKSTTVKNASSKPKETRKQNPKKRTRKGLFEDETSEDEEENNFSGISGSKPRKKKSDMPNTEENGIDHRNTSLITGENAFGSDTSASIVPFSRWRSKLNVPASCMIPILKAQLKALDTVISKEYDARAWRETQWTKKCEKFLPVHATLLQSLYVQTSGSETLMDIANSANAVASAMEIRPNLEPAFFDLVQRFISSRESLISIKSNRSSSFDRALAWLSKSENSKKAEKSGVSPSVLQSVIHLVKSHHQLHQASLLKAGAPHLPILSMASEEIKKLSVDLLVLEKRPSKSNNVNSNYKPDFSSNVGIDKHEISESAHIRSDLEHDTEIDPLELCNAFEHKKIALLLLINLYSTVSSVIL